jgi:hypothetical protein
VTRSHIKSSQCEFDRVGAVRHPDAFCRPAISTEGDFERL